MPQFTTDADPAALTADLDELTSSPKEGGGGGGWTLDGAQVGIRKTYAFGTYTKVLVSLDQLSSAHCHSFVRFYLVLFSFLFLSVRASRSQQNINIRIGIGVGVGSIINSKD